MSQHELELKLKRYLSYLDHDPDNASLKLNIANCYRLLGSYALSQNFLDDAKSLTGNPYWTEQGQLHLSNNNLVFAMSSFSEALKEVDCAINRFNLAFTQYVMGDFVSSLETLDDLGEEPLYEALMLKAKLQYHLERPAEAICLLKQLVTYNRPDSEVFGLLSLLHFDCNDIEEAERYSKLTLTIDPLDSMGCLVRVLVKAARQNVSLEELENILITNPNECRLWYVLGTTQMQQMNITAAQHAFNQAIQIWPNFFDCWISSGWCHLLQNNLDQAENAYNQAVVINPNCPDGWGGLALVHALRNEDTEAQRLLEKSLSIDANTFLAMVTQIILANQINPNQAGRLLTDTLPEVAFEINQLLNFVPNQKDKQVLH